jgi:hypothetical protein
VGGSDPHIGAARLVSRFIDTSFDSAERLQTKIANGQQRLERNFDLGERVGAAF